MQRRIDEVIANSKIVSQWNRKIKKRKITIVKLSKQSGISRTTIYSAINGYAIPLDTTINKVEEVLNKNFKI